MREEDGDEPDERTAVAMMKRLSWRNVGDIERGRRTTNGQRPAPNYTAIARQCFSPKALRAFDIRRSTSPST
jgi:hypothetical protein